MRFTTSIATLAALLLSMLPFVPGAPVAVASTCTLRPVPDPWERLDGRLDYSMELVLVGTVRSERLVNSGPTPEYESTIDVDVILRGALPDDELVVPYLSDDYNCGTSPRLRAGSRVLLVMRQLPLSANPQSRDDYYWEIGPTGGSIFFSAIGALLEDYQSDTGDSYLGENDDVIRYVAERVGASDATTARAIAAINGAPTSAQNHDSRLYFAVALLGLILAGALVFVVREKGAGHG